MTSVDIFYRGSRTFLKPLTKVEVLIVQHEQCDVLEIVCSNPETLQQAPRLYIQKTVVQGEIAQGDIQSRVLTLKKSMEKKRQDFNEPALLAQVWKAAISEYIVERLELHKRFIGSKAFRVTLRKPLYSESVSKAQPMLASFDLTGFSLPRESVVRVAQAEPVSVVNTPADDALSARDRLRIPFVFIKASKVQYLSYSEARIWKLTAMLILRDVEVHGRQAIINLESTSLCAEFAARQLARMRSASIIPSSSNKYTRPPPLDTTFASTGSGRHRDHRLKPSTPRHAELDPKPTWNMSAKLGFGALSSSVQKGLDSLTSSKHKSVTRSASTGGCKSGSSAQGSDLARKGSMVSLMVSGGKTRRSCRADQSQLQHSPSRSQLRPGTGRSTPRWGTAKSASSSVCSEASGGESFVDLNEAETPSKSSRTVWFGDMSKKFAGMVSGKLSTFVGGSKKHRTNRVGVSADDDSDDEDTLSFSQNTVTPYSDGASVITVDPAFAPIARRGSTNGGFLSNLSGKHTASTVVKVKNARESVTSNSALLPVERCKTPLSASAAIAPNRVTNPSSRAATLQIFQHITMWGGRVVIRPATAKAQRDVVLRIT